MIERSAGDFGQRRSGRRLGGRCPCYFEVCAIAAGAVCLSLRQLTRIAGTDLSRFTFGMSGTLMSASTKVAAVHACHLTIGDQKTEGWALNRTRHRRALSLRALGYGRHRPERATAHSGVSVPSSGVDGQARAMGFILRGVVQIINQMISFYSTQCKHARC
jgi:hypothetical protein